MAPTGIEAGPRKGFPIVDIGALLQGVPLTCGNESWGNAQLVDATITAERIL